LFDPVATFSGQGNEHEKSDRISHGVAVLIGIDGAKAIARYRALPGASRISKIIVKPCAGKPHARFERGLLKTGWLL
jgi:hypothetical protein